MRSLWEVDCEPGDHGVLTRILSIFSLSRSGWMVLNAIEKSKHVFLAVVFSQPKWDFVHLEVNKLMNCPHLPMAGSQNWAHLRAEVGQDQTFQDLQHIWCCEGGKLVYSYLWTMDAYSLEIGTRHEVFHSSGNLSWRDGTDLYLYVEFLVIAVIANT